MHVLFLWVYPIPNLFLLADVQDLLERTDFTFQIRAVLHLLPLHFIPRLFAQGEEPPFLLPFRIPRVSAGVKRSNSFSAQRSLLRNVGRWW